VGAGEFGRTVRRWRDRLTAEAVGLPSGSRRRAVGLRREELAQAAGISVDYLTRLEQGRADSPSAQVIEALARVLRLSDAERSHLFRLGGQAPPGRDLVSSQITPSVQRILDRLAHTPVAVYDAAWTLIVANPPYEALMGDTSSWSGVQRNGVWRNFVGPGSRAVHTPEEQAAFESGLVADLRLTAARYPNDRQLSRLIADLTRHSPRFAELWNTGDVALHDTNHKVIAHPEVGHIALDCDILTVSSNDLRIMIYTAAPGTEDADRLQLAIVLGTQRLVE
jgi:transcriptional regulator with XRE-family HTH domain